jgi:hypothetical protein
MQSNVLLTKGYQNYENQSIIWRKGNKMKKFAINAYETVIYYKVVEANSVEEVRDLLGSGEIEISGDDIVDGDDFNVEEITEVTK